MALVIHEKVDKAKDISTVYAYFTVPQGKKMCDSFTVFNQQYKRGSEREFIEQLEANNPGLYSHYLISWCDCN